jgi:nucleotide-binding universal stress UspA family protein
MEAAGERSGVIVGFDGSAQATQALDWALDEAELRGLPLILCHAWQWPYRPLDVAGRTSLRMAANHVLEHGVECARNRTSGVQVASALCEGAPARRLVEMSVMAELLVVGSRGLGDFARLVVGSVAEQVAGRASCPVIVVRGRGPLPRTESSKPLVVGVDESPGARAALGFAAREARLRGLPLHVLYAWGQRPVHGGTRAAELDAAFAGERLRKIIAPWWDSDAGLDLRPRLVNAPARAALRAAADEAGLMVVGASDHHLMPLGSLGRWLLHHVTCPVAVVPAHHAGPRPEAGPGQ